MMLIVDKEKLFSQLHHNGKLLVLPNVWDPLSALLLESLGYPAVATASASIALTNGFADGEQIPFEEVLSILKKIVKSVNIPVTADVESGYASDKMTLEKNISKLIDTGIVGINFEDSHHSREGLVSIKDQCEKIALIKNVALQKGVHLFINARSDVYLKSPNLSEQEKIEEIVRRGKAYKEAGANGFYPMLLRNKVYIERVINEVGLPVNIILLPGIPDFETLQKMKVARLSLGPGFLKMAIHAMKNTAEKLLKLEGMEEIQTNAVTGDYLNSLLPKNLK